MAYSHTPETNGIKGLFDADNNTEINMVKCKKIELTAPDDGTETTTSVSLPDSSFVVRALLNVTTAEATGTTKTLNIGTNSAGTGDADGFFAGVDVSTTGVKVGAGALVGAVATDDEITITAGSADWADFEGNLYIYYIEVV